VAAAATRLPLVPLHGWARDVLAEAQPAVALRVAGVECRLGGEVLIRLLPGAEPDAARRALAALERAATVADDFRHAVTWARQ